MEKILPLFILLFTTLFLSCSKEDSPKTKWKVSGIIGKYINDPTDSVYNKFDYSVKNEIKIYSSTASGLSGIVVYHFDDQNRISRIQHSYSSNIPGYDVGYTYLNKKVRVIQTSFTGAQHPVVDSAILYIGDNGLATRSVYYSFSKNNTIDSSSFSYVWNDHDLVSIRTNDVTPLRETKFYYDNSYNPFYITDLPISFDLNFSGSLFYACNKHNCISIKSSEDTYILKTESRDYNSDNFLSQIVSERAWTQGKFESRLDLIPQ